MFGKEWSLPSRGLQGKFANGGERGEHRGHVLCGEIFKPARRLNFQASRRK
jgi:hypothetical protein